MKKVLIIGMSLNVGGAEKSLVNLLNLMDKEKYNVDLLLFQHQGVFLKQIPDWVNVIEEPTINVLFQSMKVTLNDPQRSYKKVSLAIKRYFYTALERIKWKQFDRIRLHRWLDYYKELIPSNATKYDVGIAYAGGETAYYLVDKTECRKKVYFFHSDYSKINIDKKLEEQYVDAVDQVVTISEACKNSLQNLFPNQREKICVLQNLSSPKLINQLSCAFYPNEYRENENKAVIISVGRLINIKGYDIAIRAAKLLKERGIKFVWYVVGEGEERSNLEKDIKNFQLDEEFVLLGLKENPYPYIRNASILVQPSRFEGKSVVLDEAKILNKPIVVTAYNSAEDQIDNGVTGLIAEMTPEGLAEKVSQMLTDSILQESIVKNLIAIDDTSVMEVDNYCSVLVGG